jgi:thioredoxin 2
VDGELAGVCYLGCGMSALQMDQKGIVVSCTNCGQKNRIAFNRLEKESHCGKCKTELPAADNPVEVADEKAFQNLVAGASIPVLADFWAPWCGPCRMAMPELEKLAQEDAGETLVVKVNTEVQGWLAQRFGIQSIPTLILFSQGTEAARISGARPAAELRRFVQGAAHAPR